MGKIIALVVVSAVCVFIGLILVNQAMDSAARQTNTQANLTYAQGHLRRGDGPASAGPEQPRLGRSRRPKVSTWTPPPREPARIIERQIVYLPAEAQSTLHIPPPAVEGTAGEQQATARRVLYL